MTVKAILFDLSGTLVRYNDRPVEELYLEGGRQAFDYARSKGHELGAIDDLLKQVLAGLEKERKRVEATGEEVHAQRVVRSILQAVEVDLNPEDWTAFARAWYAPFAAGAEVVPGTLETLLSLLEHGARVGVLTNNWWGRDVVEWHLEALGLWECFDGVFVSCELGWRKPAPKAFELALRKLGASPEESVVVGSDPVEDVEGARAAGIRVLHFGVDVPDMGALTKRLGGLMI